MTYLLFICRGVHIYRNTFSLYNPKMAHSTSTYVTTWIESMTYMYMTRMQTSTNIYSLQVFHVHSKIPWLQFKCLHHNHINWTQDLRICQSTNQNVLTVEKRLRRFNEVPIVQFCLSEDTTKNRGQVNAKMVPGTQKLSVVLKLWPWLWNTITNNIWWTHTYIGNWWLQILSIAMSLLGVIRYQMLYIPEP